MNDWARGQRTMLAQQRATEDRINVGLFRVDKDEDVAVDPVDGWVYLNGGWKGVLSLESVSREELR